MTRAAETEEAMMKPRRSMRTAVVVTAMVLTGTIGAPSRVAAQEADPGDTPAASDERADEPGPPGVLEDIIRDHPVLLLTATDIVAGVHTLVALLGEDSRPPLPGPDDIRSDPDRAARSREEEAVEGMLPEIADEDVTALVELLGEASPLAELRHLVHAYRAGAEDPAPAEPSAVDFDAMRALVLEFSEVEELARLIGAARLLPDEDSIARTIWDDPRGPLRRVEAEVRDPHDRYANVDLTYSAWLQSQLAAVLDAWLGDHGHDVPVDTDRAKQVTSRWQAEIGSHRPLLDEVDLIFGNRTSGAEPTPGHRPPPVGTEPSPRETPGTEPTRPRPKTTRPPTPTTTPTTTPPRPPTTVGPRPPVRPTPTPTTEPTTGTRPTGPPRPPKNDPPRTPPTTDRTPVRPKPTTPR